MSQPITSIESDQFEASCDEAIALCGGDARSAVKALLIANAFLEEELALAKVAVSYGYSRGWHAKRDDPLSVYILNCEYPTLEPILHDEGSSSIFVVNAS
jgi:DNA primase catalytic subunit